MLDLKITLLYPLGVVRWPCTRYLMILVSVEPEVTECDGKDCSERTVSVPWVDAPALGAAWVTFTDTRHRQQHRYIRTMLVCFISLLFPFE